MAWLALPDSGDTWLQALLSKCTLDPRSRFRALDQFTVPLPDDLSMLVGIASSLVCEGNELVH